jgi:hypothetical protein
MGFGLGRGRAPHFSSVRNLFRGAGKMNRRADDLKDLADNLNDAGRVSRTHCFTAGTQVVMADQEQAMVADDVVLESGDWLIASLVGLAVGGSTLAKSRRKNGQPPSEDGNVRTDRSDAAPEDDVSHTEVIDPDVAEEFALPHSAGDSSTDRAGILRWQAVGAAVLSGSLALLFALLMLGKSSRPEQSATPLAAARPQTKAIESIVVGDVVLAKDPATGEVGPRTVTQVFRRQSDHLRLLDIRGSDGTEQRIETTDEHPFWVAGRGWVEAGDLAQAISSNNPLVTGPSLSQPCAGMNRPAFPSTISKSTACILTTSPPTAPAPRRCWCIIATLVLSRRESASLRERRL